MKVDKRINNILTKETKLGFKTNVYFVRLHNIFFKKFCFSNTSRSQSWKMLWKLKQIYKLV